MKKTSDSGQPSAMSFRPARYPALGPPANSVALQAAGRQAQHRQSTGKRPATSPSSEPCGSSPAVACSTACNYVIILRGNETMAEPRIVVAHREHLWWLLAEAAQQAGTADRR
jgi:hypothetical protein